MLTEPADEKYRTISARRYKLKIISSYRTVSNLIVLNSFRTKMIFWQKVIVGVAAAQKEFMTNTMLH